MNTRSALLTVALPLVAFKVWATVLLLIFAPTPEGLAWAVGTGWPWLAVLAVCLAAPALAWYRLVRVRRRRAELLRSEWMVPTSRSG